MENIKQLKGSVLRVVPGNYKNIPPSLRKRASLRLIVDGIDKTPKPLFFDAQESIKELEDQVETSITTPHTAEILGTTSSSLHLTKGTSVEFSSIQHPFEELEIEQFTLFGESEPSETSVEIPPLPPKLSQLLKPKEQKVPEPEQREIRIILKETHTVFHLSLPSLTVDVNTEEGRQIKSDNEYYEYITVGKGRHRNVKTAEVQTEYSIRKTRSTMAPPVETKESSAMADAWDLHQSYNN